MFEKVNPMHPDKIADRIAGAIVDLAYRKDANAKMACEVLIGHGMCHIICETNVEILLDEVKAITSRIVQENHKVDLVVVKQDEHLAKNQEKLRCGDNGIFKGMPVTPEQKTLTKVAKYIYDAFKSDGKYIYDDEKGKLILCQSLCLSPQQLYKYCPELSEMFPFQTIAHINPIGYWTGGINVDTGATNRKLGSDMGDAVTGGGLHGKDLSKADVAVNIFAHLKAQETGKPVELYCAIGDEKIDGLPYSEVVEIARNYIDSLGGFEKLAEWGLI